MGLQAIPNTEEKTPVIFFNSTPVLPAIAGENHKITSGFTRKDNRSSERAPKAAEHCLRSLPGSPARQLFQTWRAIASTQPLQD